MVFDTKPIDFEAFLARPENKGRSFELINGEIVEKMPTMFHSFIQALIASALTIYLRGNPIAWALTEARSKLPGDDANDLIPDVSVVLKANRALLEKGAMPYLPDLVVEIKSPDDKLWEMRKKADYYLAHGTKIVWLVHSEKRLVYVLTATSDDTLDENDTLNGGDLLPGFTLAVKDIFPQE